jgi:hypothetical protein
MRHVEPVEAHLTWRPKATCSVSRRWAKDGGADGSKWRQYPVRNPILGTNRSTSLTRPCPLVLCRPVPPSTNVVQFSPTPRRSFIHHRAMVVHLPGPPTGASASAKSNPAKVSLNPPVHGALLAMWKWLPSPSSYFVRTRLPTSRCKSSASAGLLVEEMKLLAASAAALDGMCGMP